MQQHTAIMPRVMVWGMISYDQITIPPLFSSMALTAHHYIELILQSVALPFLCQVSGVLSSRMMCAYILHMYLGHYSSTQQCLQRANILPWPAQSPVLSITEHIWIVMGC